MTARRNRFSFERLRSKSGGKISNIMEKLNVFSVAVIYRLKDPVKYSWDARLFDRRSDYCDRLAEIAEVTTKEVEDYYLDLWKTNKEQER